MLTVLCLLEASAKKSAAREALVYFEHFQADGTCNMSNLSTANRMQVESGGPGVIRTFLSFGTVLHACRQDLEKVLAISKQETSKAGMAKFFSFRYADAKPTTERFALP